MHGEGGEENCTFISFFTLVILTAFVVFSCSSSDDSSDNNPPAQTTADIIGSVNLYDEGTNLVNGGGMTVRLIDPSAGSTVTDNSGNFTLSDIPAGTYTLSFEKTGYGTFQIPNLQHASNGGNTIITESPSLGQSSSTMITGLFAKVVDDVVRITIATDPAGNNGNPRYIRYFLSTQADVSASNYQYNSPGFTVQINPANLQFSASDLQGFGFSSGDTVYMKVYGDSFWSNTYTDPDTSLSVYPNLNDTSPAAVSFMVP